MMVKKKIAARRLFPWGEKKMNGRREVSSFRGEEKPKSTGLGYETDLTSEKEKKRRGRVTRGKIWVGLKKIGKGKRRFHEK